MLLRSDWSNLSPLTYLGGQSNLTYLGGQSPWGDTTAYLKDRLVQSASLLALFLLFLALSSLLLCSLWITFWIIYMSDCT